LTNPDGTFRMQGVPPGQYYIYAHTIPPDHGIYGPWNADGSVAKPSSPTNALFFPGTTDLRQATPISVQAGKSTDNINIGLESRPSVELYDVQIFGYLNNNTIAIEPAFLDMLAVNSVGGGVAVNAVGTGLGSNGQAPGLGVQVLGGSAYVYGKQAARTADYTYVSLFIGFSPGAGPGPQHVIFTTPDYMYVLPAGFTITQKEPPTVAGVSPNGDGTVSLTGTNWSPDSLIYFDGLPASISSLDAKKGTAVVTPPPGASGQTSVVTVYNTDGQNSQMVQSASPVTYSYDNAAAPSITSISPSSLPAGAEAMVDITGSGFTFAPGMVTVGFGTTDILVRRVFVLSPNHVQVDVSVSPNAALSNPDLSVISGFQLAVAAGGFQITAAVPGLPSPIPVLTNALSGLTGSYAGAVVSLYGSNLSSPNAATSVTFNGKPAALLYTSPGQINLQIPSGLPAGPVTLSLNNGAVNAYPVTVKIDTAPATIGAIQNASGAYIDSSHPAHQGDLLIIGLNNFAPDGSDIDLSRVQVSVGGAMHSPISVVSAASGVYQVSFLLNADEQPGTSQPLIVYLDGRSSYPASVPVALTDGSFTSPSPASGN
ncbi:MAG TPA: IPT/TIG domain-containing protein, partial [Bryobacteraceae bacterium]|nr:IPT/TIG domain-containing protein [Bryobacteraceae bacterium]